MRENKQTKMRNKETKKHMESSIDSYLQIRGDITLGGLPFVLSIIWDWTYEA